MDLVDAYPDYLTVFALKGCRWCELFISAITGLPLRVVYPRDTPGLEDKVFGYVARIPAATSAARAAVDSKSYPLIIVRANVGKHATHVLIGGYDAAIEHLGIF
jgi:hypothetical protein